MPPPPRLRLPDGTEAPPQYTVATAGDFNAKLHEVLRHAGFRLCSKDDELIAGSGHFGDEHVWNVPVRRAPLRTRQPRRAAALCLREGGRPPRGQGRASAERAVARDGGRARRRW
eukprot:2785809-Prymnesium_polylepis.2